MPSLLDRILNTRINRRLQARQDAIDGFNNSSVTAISSEGINFTVPDNRASSQLARGVANQLLGHTPRSMLTRSDQSTFQAFRSDSNLGDLLGQQGIRAGSSLTDLQRALAQIQSNDSTDNRGDNGSLLTQQREQPNNVPTRRPNGQNGTGIDGNLTQSNATQTNAVEGFMNGFQNGQDQNEQDFLQLNTSVNRASDEFQRLLHGSLFS